MNLRDKLTRALAKRRLTRELTPYAEYPPGRYRGTVDENGRVIGLTPWDDNLHKLGRDFYLEIPPDEAEDE